MAKRDPRPTVVHNGASQPERFLSGHRLRWAECINVAPPRKRNREDIEAAFDEFFNPRGLRAWQLAAEHGLALECQAGKHHRSEVEQTREWRKLLSQVEKRREWRNRRQRPWHQCSRCQWRHRQPVKQPQATTGLVKHGVGAHAQVALAALEAHREIVKAALRRGVVMLCDEGARNGCFQFA